MGDQLGGDGDGDFRRRLGADGQTDGRMEALNPGLVDSGLPELGLGIGDLFPAADAAANASLPGLYIYALAKYAMPKGFIISKTDRFITAPTIAVTTFLKSIFLIYEPPYFPCW